MASKKQPNILIFMVDQERYPSVYETKELKEWRHEHLVTQRLLRENGIEFLNHYAGSSACSPSRTTLYTGQYPSLHGVTQTTGAAKAAFDPDVFWLDPNTVPTMGEYFRTAGYQTFWKGKWHASDADILIPATHNAFPSYNTSTGVPDEEQEAIYRDANRLGPFGFSGWIGPEPHGINPRNSGSSAAIGTSGRDEVYASETVKLIHSLEKQAKNDDNVKPWFIVNSFVNPHDIAIYGVLTEHNPTFNFEVDPSVPDIPSPPTNKESLKTKPTAQGSYHRTYPKALQPLNDTNFYRQLYYSLMKKADDNMYKVFRALQDSSFYEDTIILFTSDHGELLGAHGGLFQKWYNMYEESIHVPLIIHNPLLFPRRKAKDMLTSHVDILPTLLGLAGIHADDIQAKLGKDHTEVHPLSGRNLTALIKGEKQLRANEPLYFMTDDDVTKGLNQTTATGEPYESVIQPNHIEAVIAKLRTGKNNQVEIWKFARYYDNPQFWSDPGSSDTTIKKSIKSQAIDQKEVAVCITTVKTEPVAEQYELYNLTLDPLEEKNLSARKFATNRSKKIQEILSIMLEKQSKQKRLSPSSG